jgi:hypothetical protein
MRLALEANPSTRPEGSLFNSCNLRGLLDFSLTPCPRQTRLSSRTARCVVPSSSRMSSSRVWALSSAHRRRHSLTWSALAGSSSHQRESAHLSTSARLEPTARCFVLDKRETPVDRSGRHSPTDLWTQPGQWSATVRNDKAEWRPLTPSSFTDSMPSPEDLTPIYLYRTQH